MPTLAPDEGFTKFPNALRAAPWRNEPKTVAVYFYLRMNAAHFSSGWNSIALDPGQIISGRAQIAAETGLTQNEVRTAIDHLKRTGHITSSTTNKYSIFSFLDKENWDSIEDRTTSKITSRTTNRPPADHQQTTTYKRLRDVETGETRERKRFTPPTIEEATAYFAEKGDSSSEAQRFWDYYQSNGWRVGKNPMKDWHAAANGWISRNRNACRSPAPTIAKGLHAVPTAEEYSEGVDSSGFGWA